MTRAADEQRRAGDPSLDFVAYALDCGVLRFGDFTLKSGRRSPYFFNTGLFDSGARLARLGEFYARAIVDAGVAIDMLFGPAYKGIPLVAAVSIALARQHDLDLPFAFNRKEAKDHGEGGITVGAPLAGRVAIVDDVISAGTSVGESVEIIRAAGAEPAAVIIALDRQERGSGERSAAQEVAEAHGLTLVSVARLETLLSYLDDAGEAFEASRDAVRRYRERYGA